MRFTYYGQSCFLIEVAGKKILFDPFISNNPLAKDIDINSIQADYILVSHGHGDHVADLMSIAERTNATIVAAYEITEWAAQQGAVNVHPLNFGGKKQFDFGTVRFVQAMHSSVLPDGTYGGNPGGFVVTTNEGNFYYSGDTSLMMDMQLIPRYAKLDFAILPVGDNFTMGVEDAVIAAEFIQCGKIIGVHFDTFPYIKIDHRVARQQFENAGLELILPNIGETIDI
ncbi:MAG TPA: metal-dependent hydrolase [Flavipsychrobacter sp.]|jgi:L-ascorbate metabolism protein UlaG (beta-lactamase superfamily)|nr:metal-dependent hydrolase [Flavipsychrobacter sp.]